MAVVKMKKLTLYGLKTEESKILSELHKTEGVQILQMPQDEKTSREVNVKNRDELALKLNRLRTVIEFVTEQGQELAKTTKKLSKLDSTCERYKLPLKPLFAVRDEVGYDEFSCISMRDVELFSIVDELEKDIRQLSENRSEQNRMQNIVEQVKNYTCLSSPFSEFQDTNTCEIMLGIYPETSRVGFEKLKDMDCVEANILGNIQNPASFVGQVVYLKDDSTAVHTALTELSFTRCPFFDNLTPNEKLGILRQDLAEKERGKLELMRAVTQKTDAIAELHLLYDYYSVELEKVEAGNDFDRTKATFHLAGWVPITKQEMVTNVLHAASSQIEFDFSDPLPEDVVPTLMKENKLVAPFVSVTNMYSPPQYRERDPTPSLSIFFFLFFGIMLSDAAYGLLLVVAAAILIRFVRMEDSMKKLVWVILWGGVATTIWGALFGGWFGIQNPNIPRLFDPMTNPVPVFIMCLAFGVIQIIAGLIMKGIALVSAHKIVDAICDVGSWLVLFVGLICVALSMAIPALAVLLKVGLGIGVFGVLMLLFTQGRHEKNFFKKIVGGLGGLYNIINLMSDILSYSRLFALCLATGVIAMVMNILGNLVFGLGPIGWILGIAIYIGGHLFNIAINVLGAYVHNCRLQYVEYFSKFYEGGGIPFMPMGSQLKYTILKPIESNK